MEKTKIRTGTHFGTCNRYEEYCHNCEYCKKEEGHNETFYYCRFNPPVAVLIEWSKEEDKVIARWPEVPSTAWCGQWRKERGEDNE